MTHTVRQLMDEQAAGLVGRDDEMAVLRQLLGEGGPLVVFVHGIAGIGKTALVEAFAVEARARGTTVLRLDCRSIEPTERGFIAALESKIGGQLATAEDAAARLGSLGDRVVLLLDTYEVLRILDPWLRQSFVPALADNVRLILSGREAPMTGWPSALGGLFRGLAIENLAYADAEALLVRAGVDHEAADRIYRLARGHPLSLRLAASALTERPGVSLEAVTVKAIVEELTELYLGVLDPRSREALDAASVVRRATLSLLAAMLPGSAPQDAFDRLRALPFVELGDDGLVLHDTVREAICCPAHRSPIRTAPGGTGPRRGGGSGTRSRAPRATRCGGTRPTSSTSSRTRPSARRSSRRPSTSSPSRSPSRTISRRSPTSSRDTSRARRLPSSTPGGGRHPGAFRVARDRLGAVAGFSAYGEMDSVSHRLVQLDPVVRQFWEHLRSHPVPRGQRILFSRMMISRDFGEGWAPVQAALWLDLKRRYMELRPNLGGSTP